MARHAGVHLVPSDGQGWTNVNTFAAGLTTTAAVSVVGVIFVIVVIAIHLDKAKKDANRFLLSLFLFDLFFCGSELYYGLGHFLNDHSMLTGHNSSGNCIATGANGIGLTGITLSIAVLYAKGLYVIMRKRVFSTRMEVAIYTAITVLAVGGGLTTWGDEPHSYECNQFWSLVAIVSPAAMAVPVILGCLFAVVGRWAARRGGSQALLDAAATEARLGLNDDREPRPAKPAGFVLEEKLFESFWKDLRLYPWCYLLFVAAYILCSVFTVMAHNDMEATGRMRPWASPTIQSFWIILAMQPMFHIAIFFAKADNREKAICRHRTFVHPFAPWRTTSQVFAPPAADGEDAAYEYDAPHSRPHAAPGAGTETSPLLGEGSGGRRPSSRGPASAAAGASQAMTMDATARMMLWEPDPARSSGGGAGGGSADFAIGSYESIGSIGDLRVSVGVAPAGPMFGRGAQPGGGRHSRSFPSGSSRAKAKRAEAKAKSVPVPAQASHAQALYPNLDTAGKLPA